MIGGSYTAPASPVLYPHPTPPSGGGEGMVQCDIGEGSPAPVHDREKSGAGHKAPHVVLRDLAHG